MVKNLDDGSKNWNVYVPDLGNTYLELNNTTSGFTGSSYFNNTSSRQILSLVLVQQDRQMQVVMIL